MYADPDVANAINKMDPEQLREDLRQEIFLVLCEKPEADILQMYRDGWLKFFIVRTMLNMIKSDRSTFWYKYRRQFEEVLENMQKVNPVNGDEHRDTIRIKSAVESLHWYESKLIEIYASNGQNIAQISRDTGIPYRSLFKTIKKVKIKLRKEVKGEPTPDESFTVTMSLKIDIRFPNHEPDTILAHIDDIDNATKVALESVCNLQRYEGFRLK